MSEHSPSEPRRPLPGDKIIDPGDGSMCRGDDLQLPEKLKVVCDRNESLEGQLHERTLELQEANERLKREIAERKRLEAALHETRLELEQASRERAGALRAADESLPREAADQRRVEDALRESDRKYRMLFENMTAGFALHEMIYDEQGRPLDYRYLEINPAFERLTGVPVKTLLGKTVKEVMPGTEQYWIDVFGKVARTGEPAACQNYASELNRYYDVWAFSPAKNQFAVVFVDITERKRAEELLHQRVEELAALNLLGRTVSATLSLEEAIKAALAEMLRAVHPDLAFLFLRDRERLILKDVAPRDCARVWAKFPNIAWANASAAWRCGKRNRCIPATFSAIIAAPGKSASGPESNPLPPCR